AAAGPGGGPATGRARPSAKSLAGPFRPPPGPAPQSSAPWPPPGRAASSITRGPSGPSRTCVYVGPSVTPTAAAAARAASTAPAVSSPEGQACASATPKAGGAALNPPVTLRGANPPPVHVALPVHPR